MESKEIELEINDTTFVRGYVFVSQDIIGDSNVINGTQVVYFQEVHDLRVEFSGINVTSLLSKEQKEHFKTSVLAQYDIES